MKNKDYTLLIIISTVVIIISSVICFLIKPICAVICFTAGLIITAVYVNYTKKRYSEIEMLNSYLELVCAGNYKLDVENNSEGELSILKNNIYKVIKLLRFSNDALEKDKAYLADSLADISHQLKTPLTSVMVMTDLISNESSSDKTKEFAKIIESQTEKMKWLISTLLKISKLDSGVADFKRESFFAKSAIEESLKPFMIAIDLMGITLNVNIDDFEITGDRSWSVEAFANIIKNCIEHMNENGKLEISSTKTTIYNEIIIKDNGCGIAPEDLPHIFERFYHGKNSDSDSVGIGLALAKTVFEREKGAVSAQSRENEGTAFSIKFYKSIV